MIARLCLALAAEDVRYCHWKSTATLDRAQLGEGDLDLLVDRRGSQRFLQVLRRLGFKEARAARELPGVFHAYGFDAPSGRLVHVHAHYTLVLGDDMTKNYRLPVEDAYLARAMQGAVFRVPAPEFELAVLVVRLVLKHAAWDAILIGRGPLSAAEAHELQDLTSRVKTTALRDCVRAHLPAIGESLWQDCLQALQPGAKLWFRAWTARRLEASLASCGRRPWATDTLLKLWRRVGGFLLRRVARRRNPRLRLDSGGALIAVVGGDDARRASVVTALHAWLAHDFEAVTLPRDEPQPAPAAESTPKASSQRTIANLARGVMRARSLCWRYVRARRLACRGTLVVCDGFPAREPGSEDATATRAAAESGEGALRRRLARLELSYADQLPDPDLLVVLRPGPVTAGSEQVPRAAWRHTPACVVDAARPLEGVVADIKQCVWSSL